MGTRAADRGYVLDLRSVSRHDIGRAGVKAANLGELVRAGFPVPGGFVLTTAAFERFVAHNALRPDSSSETVTRGVLPADVTDALIRAATDLGDVSLAVRSSPSSNAACRSTLSSTGPCS